MGRTKPPRPPRYRQTIPGPAFSWESQVKQYPELGAPGIGYFKGDVSDTFPGKWVDCLLFRDPNGQLVGILNHYPFDFPLEDKGSVNIWVHPRMTRRGIGTQLWDEAVKKWQVSLDKQRFTEAGAKFANALARRVCLIPACGCDGRWHP
jgi:GNAT superfamily N-acetyltransferase